MPKLVSDGLTASEFQAIKSSSGASGSANSGPKIQVPHIATVPSLKFDLCIIMFPCSISVAPLAAMQITCENLSIEVGRDVKSRKLALTNVNATFGASKVRSLWQRGTTTPLFAFVF